MALSATIFKATLQISDLDRNHYAEHELILARHPSETDERMMVRLLAFALHADERLNFTRGLCVDEEPDLWQKGLADEIDVWIEVGLPDERRVRKACGRARQVWLYLYGGRAVEPWWQRNADKLRRFANLRVIELPEKATRGLAGLARRSMRLSCTVQDGEIWLSDEEQSLAVTPRIRLGPGADQS